MPPSEEEETSPPPVPADAHGGDPTIHRTGAEDPTISDEADGDPTMILGGDPDATLATPPPGMTGERAEPSRTESASHVFANRFEVSALLGEGGMGRVYRVRDRQIEGREVALKVLRPRFSKNERFRDLFFQEIRAAQKFVSENVNQVRDTGQMEDGRLFLTMDLVDGESLHDLLRREQQLNTRHALEIVRQALLGLQSGHEQGFVHRDIKPSNIMMAARVPKTDQNSYGVGVRLLDFGIAALAAEVSEGQVSGTPMYMSPEQSQGQRLDARSDLFSVGIVLYEMLSGSRPFEGSTLEEVSTSLLETKVAPMVKGLEHLKPSVQKILRRALEKDREKRFASASEFIAAIEGSKAYKLPTGVPAWVGGMLGISLFAAVGEGYVIFTQLRETGRIQSRFNSEETNLLAKHVKDMETQRSRFEEIVAGVRTELSEKETALEEKNLRINELLADLSDQGDDEVLEASGQQVLAQQIEMMKDQLKEARRERDLLAKEAKALADKVRAQDRATQPRAQAAEGLDKILDFIDGGHGAEALERFRRLAESQLFAEKEIGGRDFLADLAGAAAGLDAFSTSGTREELEGATAKLERVERSLEPFRIASGAWMDYALEVDADGKVDRLARVEAAIASLRVAIDGEYEILREASLERAQSIVDGPADQDPDPVIAHGETYGWDELGPFLERLVVSVRACEVDGELDLGALRANTVLDRWGAYAHRHPDALGADVADPIRWFWYARRWYVDRDPEGLSIRLEDDPAASSWRTVLALQFGLFHSLGESTRRTRTYLDQQIGRPTRAWVVDSVVGTEQGDEVVWVVRRKTLTERGGDLESRDDELRYTFRDGELLGNDNRAIVDLFDPAAQTAVWRPGTDGEIPRNRSLPRREVVDEFRERLLREPIACLVVEDLSTDTTRWASAEYGVVREERRDVYVLELVHAED